MASRSGFDEIEEICNRKRRKGKMIETEMEMREKMSPKRGQIRGRKRCHLW
jgi:hypothetical protein